MSCVLKCVFFYILLNVGCLSAEKITLKNHEKISNGEWLVKFYADWCRACQQFAPVWDQLSIMDYQDSGIRFGEVNIEREPHLSVKYSVRYLPTVYHIKDGVVRPYEGEREVGDIEDFINKKKYLQAKPLSWYNDPNGVVIYLLLQFVNAYEYFMEFQQSLTQKHGFSTKVAAGITYFAASLILITISFACALSLIPVINFFLPKQPSDFDEMSSKKHSYKSGGASTTDDDDDDDDDSDDNEDAELASSSSKNGKSTTSDLRERKRNQQKKRASRE